MPSSGEGPAGHGLWTSPWTWAAVSLAVWAGVTHLGWLPTSVLPSPLAVVRGGLEELTSGRLVRDLIASLFRVGVGFGLAVATAIPAGLVIGLSAGVRRVLLPLLNFMRALSPLAWLPFVVLWFGVGDLPAIVIIFLAVFFPLALSTAAAVAHIPRVYFRVARDHGLGRRALLFEVTLPAILPAVVTALRVGAGLAWLVVVAAEMIAGRDGLGFAIQDARNGLRADLLVFEMAVIGALGVACDGLLSRLRRAPSLRWGYEG